MARSLKHDLDLAVSLITSLDASLSSNGGIGAGGIASDLEAVLEDAAALLPRSDIDTASRLANIHADVMRIRLMMEHAQEERSNASCSPLSDLLDRVFMGIVNVTHDLVGTPFNSCTTSR